MYKDIIKERFVYSYLIQNASPALHVIDLLCDIHAFYSRLFSFINDTINSRRVIIY